MHVLIVPFGSHGDVHPMLGLGRALRGRGHRVTFLVSEYFGPLVRGLGFAMEPIDWGLDFREVLADPDLWHPTRGFAIVARLAVEGARHTYRAIEALNEPGETVAVGGTMALGVRLAGEKLGVPSATVNLQPGSIHSDHETPVYGGLATAGWPTWIKRRFFDLVYARMIEPRITPGLNALRAEVGLPPLRELMRGWLHSPQLVLNFFPSWFAATQPDWPANARSVGFPLYDERDATPMPAWLDAFLDDGPPPVAFTPGSANLQGRPFFEAAADACRRLGRRGLLLTRFPEQVPAGLPEGVRHVEFAPFGLLLPRCAAVVHHGGVGSAAQGMAAGVPQLIMPLAHDQFDNAARMRRLGVARSVPVRRFRGPRVAAELSRLLDSAEVAASCRAVAARFASDPDPMARASEAIEALALGVPIPAR